MKKIERTATAVVMGLRCSPKDFTFAILAGTKQFPDLLVAKQCLIPKGFSNLEMLKWFLQEIQEICRLHSPLTIAIKETEGPARKGNSFLQRHELETLAKLAGANQGVSKIIKKVKATIAKDLVGKGKGGYLATKLDTSVITDFDSAKPEWQEAVLVAWSELP